MTKFERLQIDLLKEMLLQNLVIVKLLAHSDGIPTELKTIAASVAKSSSEKADEVATALSRTKRSVSSR